jgi:hypothetical protein
MSLAIVTTLSKRAQVIRSSPFSAGVFFSTNKLAGECVSISYAGTNRDEYKARGPAGKKGGERARVSIRLRFWPLKKAR